MATPVIQQVVVVPAPQDQVMAQLMSVSGADSYAPSAQSADTLTLSRRRIPVWAIVLAILFFPIGLLFLLVKNTEIVQITLGRVQGGTQVTVDGRASGPLMSALQYALSGYRATPAALPTAPGPVPGPPPAQAPPQPPPREEEEEEEEATEGPRIPPPYGPPTPPPPPPAPPGGPLPGGMPGGPPPGSGPPGGQQWEPPAPPGAPPAPDAD